MSRIVDQQSVDTSYLLGMLDYDSSHTRVLLVTAAYTDQNGYFLQNDWGPAVDDVAADESRSNRVGLRNEDLRQYSAQNGNSVREDVIPLVDREHLRQMFRGLLILKRNDFIEGMISKKTTFQPKSVLFVFFQSTQ